MHRRNAGFTIVELTATVVIMSLLASIVFAATNTAMNRSRSGACLLQVRDLCRITNMYYEEYDALEPTLSWPTQIAQYVAEPRVLYCLSDPQARIYRGSANALPQAYTSYGLNCHAYRAALPSRTVLVCDATRPLFSLTPGDWNYQTVVNDLIGMRHPTCVNAGFRDGHAEALTQGVTPWLLYNHKPVVP